METLTCGPTADPRRVRVPDGRVLDVPAGWELLAPGDAGLTRRVKAAGPSWTVVEKVGRKLFSRGVWAEAARIASARAELEVERADPAYANRLNAGRARREKKQVAYVGDFRSAVLDFLAFDARYEALARSLAAGTVFAIPAGSWAGLARLGAVPLALAILEVYLLGIIRDSLTRGDRKARERLASISRGAGLLKRQVRALQAANQELEERISRQEDSITSLYSQVQVLSSQNLAKAIVAILQMTERYIGATRCSIWQHRPADKCLAFVGGIGRDPRAETSTLLPDEGTIEGWVVRNASMFSVKMVLSNEVLARMDNGRNIITLPIVIGRRAWGVLNVEEMPFARYNLYSERLLQVIRREVEPHGHRRMQRTDGVGLGHETPDLDDPVAPAHPPDWRCEAGGPWLSGGPRVL